jgi:ribose transport system permease protein
VSSNRANFTDLGTKTEAGVPVVGWVLISTFLVGSVVLARTVYGRSIYAVGGNFEAARLAGLRVNLIRGSTYLLTGGAAAIAGAMLASQTGVGQPQVVGDFTLQSIAIVIIGGTSLLGGEGALWRTVIGLMIIATIGNLFDSLALGTAQQSLVQGSIVLFAVAIDSYTRRRRT